MDMARNKNIRLKRQSPGSKVDWPEQQERRGSPRFNVSGEGDSIRTIPAFLLVDISASGVGLSADYPVWPGDMVRVSIKDGISADALVVSCRLGDSANRHLLPEFRLGCKFMAHQEGQRLLERMTG